MEIYQSINPVKILSLISIFLCLGILFLINLENKEAKKKKEIIIEIEKEEAVVN